MSGGKIKIEFVGNFFLKTIAKRFVLLGISVSKEKIKTYKDLNQKINGKKTTNFESDKRILKSTIQNFDREYPINTKLFILLLEK